jgi:hypothetical protein
LNLLKINNLQVSCSQNGSEWVWVLKSNSSTTNELIINNDLTINTKIFFDSNLVVQPNVDLSISASNSSVEVNGCVTLKGDLNLIIDFELKESKNFNLINYNCSNNTSSIAKDVNLLYNTTQNRCLSSKTQVTSNSISAIVNPSCRNVALIVGLSVGIPVSLILIAVGSIFLARWVMNRDVEKYKQSANIEMEKRKKQEDNNI